MTSFVANQTFNALAGQATFASTSLPGSINARFMSAMMVTPIASAPTAFLAGRAVRPPQLIKPQLTPSVFLDPFKNKADLINLSQADVLDLPSGGMLLESLDKHLDSARTKIGEQSVKSYREVLHILELPFGTSSSGSGMLHEYVNDGTLLYAEAVLGASLSAADNEIQPAIKRLDKTESLLNELSASPAVDQKIAQTKLLHSFMLMRFASNLKQQQIGLLDRAEKLLAEVYDEFLSTPSIISRDVFLFSDLLRIEINTRRAEIEHYRGNRGRRYRALSDLVNNTNYLLNTYEDLSDRERETVASYAADASLFLSRMQLWGKALDIARTITTHDTFGNTNASAMLLSASELEPFVAEDKSRVLSPSEIKERSLIPGWAKRIQAAIYTAHAESIGQSAKAGIAGAAAGIVAEQLLTGGLSVYGGGIGAMAATTLNRFINGFRSEEAESAGKTGIFVRKGRQTAFDFAKLIAGGTFDGAVYGAIPASFVMIAPEAWDIISEVGTKTYDLYIERFGSWLVESAEALGKSETYEAFFAGLSNGISDDSIGFIAKSMYTAYLAFTGGLFVSNIFFPKTRTFAKKAAPFLIPGALLLSSELGMAVHDGSLWNRVGRAAIIFAEISGVMLTWGLASIANRSTFKEGVKSMGIGLKEMNYMLPISAAIIQGISSAIGGRINTDIEPSNMAALAVQAAMTVMALLPLTLLISGVLKGKIPIAERFKEGWQDSEGNKPLKRVMEVFLSTISSFNMPYAHNRIFRAPTWDLTSSMLRVLDWDSNTGQFYMSGINNICGNHATAMMWTEIAGSLWERDKIVAVLEKTLEQLNTDEKLTGKEREEAVTLASKLLDQAIATPRDYFEKGAQNMHPAHPLMPFRSKDKLFPFHAVTRAGWPPKFPLKPNPYTYANLEQMLQGKSYEKLTSEQMNFLLEYVIADSANPDQYGTLRPLIQTLALARDSEEHGEKLKNFFDNNPWISNFFNIDLDRLSINDRKYRRKVRKEVLKKIKMDKREYAANVKADAAIRGSKATELRGWVIKKEKPLLSTGLF